MAIERPYRAYLVLFVPEALHAPGALQLARCCAVGEEPIEDEHDHVAAELPRQPSQLELANERGGVVQRDGVMQFAAAVGLDVRRVGAELTPQHLRVAHFHLRPTEEPQRSHR